MSGSILQNLSTRGGANRDGPTASFRTGSCAGRPLARTMVPRMKAAVVYESMFGNTRSVASAVAAGIAGCRGNIDVTLLHVADALPESVEVDLLVVGGPTHMRRMTSARTRELRSRSGAKSPGSWDADQQHWDRSVSMGVREWLMGLPGALGSKQAAVFDTRLSYMPALGAGSQIALALRSRGYFVDERPRCFFVESPQGPVKPGELERARAWGSSLGASLAEISGRDGPA